MVNVKSLFCPTLYLFSTKIIQIDVKYKIIFLFIS